MKTIQLKVDDNYIDLVLSMLQNLKKDVIKEINILSTKQNATKEEDDIFKKTSGLMLHYDIDPIKWQNEIRSEWD